jgi:CRISPR-associated endoribonuclease Cas6
MRIAFDLSPPNTLIPFTYPYELARQVHFWLGAQNPWHGSLSLYSLSFLWGSEATEAGLRFPRGAGWAVSAWDREMLARLIERFPERSELRWGMRVERAQVLPPPPFDNGRSRLWATSPVLLKDRDPASGQTVYITYKAPARASELLTAALHRKLDAAGCPDRWKELTLSFDQGYSKAKTKLINIKGIRHRASLCPLIAEGPAEAKQFLWSAGAGHSTGMGFGAIR